jgi:hypothetical protein
MHAAASSSHESLTMQTEFVSETLGADSFLVQPIRPRKLYYILFYVSSAMGTRMVVLLFTKEFNLVGGCH